MTSYRDFERVTFDSRSDRTSDGESGFLVVNARRDDKSGTSAGLLMPGLRVERRPHQVTEFGNIRMFYQNSFPLAGPQSTSSWTFSGVIRATSSSNTGFFFKGFATSAPFLVPNISVSPSCSPASRRTTLGIRTAILLPHLTILRARTATSGPRLSRCRYFVSTSGCHDATPPVNSSPLLRNRPGSVTMGLFDAPHRALWLGCTASKGRGSRFCNERVGPVIELIEITEASTRRFNIPAGRARKRKWICWSRESAFNIPVPGRSNSGVPNKRRFCDCWGWISTESTRPGLKAETKDGYSTRYSGGILLARELSRSS